MITRGDLPSGELLSELSLAEHLGVSKTPVREAFLRLREEGLVETSPRRGTYVFEMGKEQVVQLGRFRLILELAALDSMQPDTAATVVSAQQPIIRRMKGAIAADDGPEYRLLDTQFHMALIRGSQNSFLIEAYERIAWRLQAVLSRLLKEPQSNPTSFEEHCAITDYVSNGDIAAARQLVEAHILMTEERYIRIVSGKAETETV